jgi:hypothetical protein
MEREPQRKLEREPHFRERIFCVMSVSNLWDSSNFAQKFKSSVISVLKSRFGILIRELSFPKLFEGGNVTSTTHAVSVKVTKQFSIFIMIIIMVTIKIIVDIDIIVY